MVIFCPETDNHGAENSHGDQKIEAEEAMCLGDVSPYQSVLTCIFLDVSFPLIRLTLYKSFGYSLPFHYQFTLDFNFFIIYIHKLKHNLCALHKKKSCLFFCAALCVCIYMCLYLYALLRLTVNWLINNGYQLMCASWVPLSVTHECLLSFIFLLPDISCCETFQSAFFCFFFCTAVLV